LKATGFLRSIVIIAIFTALGFLTSACMPEDDSSLTQQYFAKGLESFAENNYENALPYFHSLVQDPYVRQDIKRFAYLLLGFSYYNLREFSSAEKNFSIFQKNKSGMISRVFSGVDLGPEMHLIVQMYLDTLGNKRKELEGNLTKILHKDQKLLDFYFQPISHIMLYRGYCDLYPLLDSHYEKNRKAVTSGRDEGRQLPAGPMFHIFGLQCTIMKGLAGQPYSFSPSTKTWQDQAKELLFSVQKKKMSLETGKLLDLYQFFLAQDWSALDRKARALLKESPNADVFELLVRMYQLRRDSKSLVALLDEYQRFFSPRNQTDTYNQASYYSVAGQSDAAFRALERLFELGYRNLTYIDHDPDLKFIRKDPRFEKLLERYFPKRDRRL